jgi:hypothetical protein
MKFQKRDRAPVENNFKFLMREGLDSEKVMKEQIYLKQNRYETYDGLLPSSSPTLDGTFWDVEERQRSNHLINNNNLFFMMTLRLGNKEVLHTREVYNLMDLVGDLGGVFEVVISIIGIFMFPISNHSFVFKALEKLFLARTLDTSIFEKT